ncbi:MAG: S1 RNA-binding domain-containing protein, partial [Thermodesulfobacteriota bacterium]
EGDVLELYVVSLKHGEIHLARSMGREGDIEQLQQAAQSKIPVEGKVKETCKGGFKVSVMNRTAFCPMSQIDINHVEDPETMPGQTLRFLINRVEENGKNIVVSRRQLLEKERAEALQNLQEQTQPGDIIQGKVTRLASFGAFVEIAPQVEGLVHLSEMSWSKTLSPEEIVSPGDKVSVKFLSLDQTEDKKPRIQLSLKQAGSDPREEAMANLQPGMIVTGTVTRTASFGVFVELAPGVEGLVHISEISHIKRVHKPENEVSPGDEVAVMIKEVDSESGRISLSMRDAEGDPWLDVPNRYKKGQVVQGVVEKKEDFGVFVRLEPGVVGLLHSSKLESSPEISMNKISPEDKITVSIESMDAENRRISLATAEDPTSGDLESYAPKEEAKTSLGAKLQEARQKKKE